MLLEVRLVGTLEEGRGDWGVDGRTRELTSFGFLI